MPTNWGGSYHRTTSAGLEVYHHDSDRYLPVTVRAAPRTSMARAVSTEPPIERSPAGEKTGSHVAYGVWFDEWTFQVQRETALLYYILAPRHFLTGNAPVGASDWYYLTASNRAARGVEALIGYWDAGGEHAAQEARFWVKDWAMPRDESWAVEMSWASLQPYLESIDYGVDGGEIPTLLVVNGTRVVGPDRWRNEVFLYSPSETAFHEVHAFEYGASAADQYDASGAYAGWGPILESGTDAQKGSSNPAGFYGAKLAQDGIMYDLTASSVSMRYDDPRVRRRYPTEEPPPNLGTWVVDFP